METLYMKTVLEIKEREDLNKFIDNLEDLEISLLYSLKNVLEIQAINLCYQKNKINVILNILLGVISDFDLPEQIKAILKIKVEEIIKWSLERTDIHN